VNLLTKFKFIDMKPLFFVLIVLMCTPVFSQTKDVLLSTEVSDVTVFINGAQVTRKKSIELQPGTQLIKFTGLSPYIDAKSIQLKTNEKVIVLSVNHQFNFTDSVSKSKELNALFQKHEAILEKQNLEMVTLEIITEELAFLRDNRDIGGKNQELSLNNFRETSVFYKDKITTLKLKEIEVKKNIAKLKTEREAVDDQMSQISKEKTLPSGEVLAKLNVKALTKCDLELSYFVNNAGWFPTYDIRVQSIDEPVNLIYKANIRQNTREEWKNIKLKLSSTNPNLGNLAPQLQSYFLNYNSLPPKYNQNSNQISGRVVDADTKEALIGVSIMVKGSTIGTVADVNGAFSITMPNNKSQLTFSYIGYEPQTLFPGNQPMNVFLKPSAQSLDEVVVVGYGAAKSEFVESMTGRVSGLDVKIRGNSSINKSANAPLPVTQVENQTSFEFEIKMPYTINSDNQNTVVDIDNYNLDAAYEYYCVPKIDKDAFLMAQIVNWEKYNLMEGEANIFFENTFVGKSLLDVRYISDTLNISLGRDKNVVIKREKVKDQLTKQFLGSKKEETRTWQISLKNNKKQAISLKLFDQIPVSTLDEIEVTPVNISGAAFNKDNGEIKWDLKLEPAVKKDLILKYSVKYPKDRNLIIE